MRLIQDLGEKFKKFFLFIPILCIVIFKKKEQNGIVGGSDGEQQSH